MGKRLIILGFAFCMLLWPFHAFAETVIIDPGHGGHDPGAIGVNGLKEKDVNLDIALKLKNELLQRGYEVVMTRDTDRFLSLQERVDIARRVDGDLFVSIHANFHKKKNVRGSLILYYDDRYREAAYPASREMAMLTDENYALAAGVLESMVGQIQTENRGLVPSSVFVTRNGRVPSILVESAFLSNAADAALLSSGSFRSNAAKGIADGISRYELPVFFDIAKHWAKEPVLRLEKLGVVRGNRHQYEPDRSMTRAEFMTLLDQIFSTGGTEVEPTPEPTVYSDMKETHWAFATMEKAIKLGILTGYEDGTIRPDQPLSRAEMAVVFDRIAMKDIVDVGNTQTFEDVPAQSWFAPAVVKMFQQGWIKGTTATTFAPEKTMTRAEAASIVDRFLGSPTGEIVRHELESRQSVL